MERELRNLLDRIYELEGLVHLALKRTDLHADFLRLISQKGVEIGGMCNDITSVKYEDQSLNNGEDYDKEFCLDEYSLEHDSNEDEDFNTALIQKSIASNDTNQEASSGKLVFSINEKYRFKKELFNNSELEFNNTLVLVASMEDFEEAEDYFINDLGWNTATPEVKDFLEIIRRYFK